MLLPRCPPFFPTLSQDLVPFYGVSRLTLTENGNLVIQKVYWAVLLDICASLSPTHGQDQTQDVEREKQLKPTAYMGFCWALKMESEVKPPSHNMIIYRAFCELQNNSVRKALLSPTYV